MLTKLGEIIFNKVFGVLKSQNQKDGLRFSLRLSSFLIWPFPQRRRRNIRYLHPDLSKKKQRELVQRQMRYDALLRVHVAHMRNYSVDQFLRDFVYVEGESKVKRALKEGKGAVIVGGHCGTWWACPAALAAGGYKTNIIVNPDLFPPVLQELKRLLNGHFGINLIYAKQNAHEKVLEALERGELVYLNVDVSMRSPSRSVRFPFLGGSILMDPGPALLVLLQGVTVFWASSYHRNDQRPGIILKTEPRYGHGCELHTRDKILQHWVSRLEQDLEENPEQWWPLSTKELEKSSRASQEFQE